VKSDNSANRLIYSLELIIDSSSDNNR
jgi:hypothetical protein